MKHVALSSHMGRLDDGTARREITLLPSATLPRRGPKRGTDVYSTQQAAGRRWEGGRSSRLECASRPGIGMGLRKIDR